MLENYKRNWLSINEWLKLLKLLETIFHELLIILHSSSSEFWHLALHFRLWIEQMFIRGWQHGRTSTICTAQSVIDRRRVVEWYVSPKCVKIKMSNLSDLGKNQCHCSVKFIRPELKTHSSCSGEKYEILFHFISRNYYLWVWNNNDRRKVFGALLTITKPFYQCVIR